MNEPILLILAAGMGSRYGGLKQMDPVGSHGETILDYSIYDARRAGFKRVLFLIKRSIEADFKAMIGARIAPHMEVMYAYQELDALPAGFQVPEGRVKPWGTGHAVLCAKPQIDAPFAVINADDYYGVTAFQLICQRLKAVQGMEDGRFAMVGFQVENTVTQNGHVARGVCAVSPDGLLQSIHERTHIIDTVDGVLYTEDGDTYHRLPRGTLVSMNMWGFTPVLLTALERGFPTFLQETLRTNPMKGEYFLPFVVDEMLQAGGAAVDVLSSPDKWYGVTYHADKPVVVDALRQYTDAGLYPAPLWG